MRKGGRRKFISRREEINSSINSLENWFLVCGRKNKGGINDE